MGKRHISDTVIYAPSPPVTSFETVPFVSYRFLFSYKATTFLWICVIMYSVSFGSNIIDCTPRFDL